MLAVSPLTGAADAGAPAAMAAQNASAEASRMGLMDRMKVFSSG
jgi:hypothetical protein